MSWKPASSKAPKRSTQNTKSKIGINSVYKVPPIKAKAPGLGGKGGGDRAFHKVGRNEPCPCGSSKKYKKCCMTARKLPVVRECGTCTACCTVLAVEVIDKAQGETCKHECETGCAIYQKRPRPCAEYRCDWLIGEFSEDDRPDKLGVIFDGAGKFRMKWGANAFQARELFTGAANNPASQAIINQLVNGRGATVMAMGFDNTRRFLSNNPEHIAEARRIAGDLLIDRGIL